MAVMSAVFKGVDEISSIFDRMASSGSHAVEQWEGAGSVANTAFSQAASSADNTTKAMQEAASSTDHWTSALGTYDKGAMEAVYTTKELVDIGYKTQAALDEEAKTATACAQAADQLTKATDAATSVQEEMTKVSEEASRVMEKVADSDKVSAETKEELSRTSDNLAQASAELTRAQEEAARAAEELAKATGTAGTSQEDLESAAERAAHAADDLAAANQNATCATDEMAAATTKATNEHEKLGTFGPDAIKAIEDVLVAAGIAKLVSEITETVIALVNEFSNAEAVIVKATGATGAQLNSLSASMMNVYAVSKTGDLSTVAGAIGEINTRLGLQGDELDQVTKLFMDYSQITGSDVVGSVQSVTKIMKNWGVEVDNTEGLLDRLAIAGQASGMSVDSLSDMVVQNKATLQQLGYGLDESIALLAMFEYEGLNSSSIMMGFRSAVTGFSADGRDASTAMQEVIEEIKNISDESEATSLAISTFGSRAGAELAYAIRNGKFEIQDWIDTIDGADGTLATTANAATTLEEKWTQASNKMNTAFSNTVSPAVNAISSAFAGLVGGIGDFLTQHPVVTAALTGIAAGILAVAAGIAIYKTATTIATVVTALFGTTLSVALWPITLIVAGIAALTAGLILLFNWLGNANQEFDSLTTTSKQHYTAVQDLNSEYERSVELYGENSEEAQRLAAELETARAVYEANKMTIEEFVAANDKLLESHQKIVDCYSDGMEKIASEEKSSTALIAKLSELSSKTELTAAEQQQMSAIVDKLNTQMPELALAYDKETGALNRSVDAVKALAKAQADQQRIETQHQTYVSVLAEEADLRDQLAKAAEEQAAAQERANLVGGMGWFGKSKQAKNDLADFKAEQERLQAALNENLALQAETEKAFEEYAHVAEEAAKATVSYENAVNSSIQGVAEDMNKLIESYDNAYESARSSIDSTIGLFDKMATKCDLSIKDMLGAMQSQVAYLETYTENLRKAAEYGLDEGLIASLSDGSEESAGYINKIIREMEKLGGTTEEAQAFAEKFNTAFKDVETAKDEFAGTVAEMETDFSSKMDEIEARMTEAIDNMVMTDDAAEAAKETIDAYVQAIKDGTTKARSAAEGVAQAAAAALSPKNISLVGVPGFAAGTIDAPDMFIAGENGPELIVGAGGSTIFPAEETNKILAAAGDVPVDTAVPDGFTLNGGGNDILNTANEKKITLDINGSGEIDVTGVDEETVWDIVAPKLKTAFMGIVKQEIFEEGDRAYGF